MMLDKNQYQLDGNRFSVVRENMMIPGWTLFTIRPLQYSYPFLLALFITLTISGIVFLMLLNMINKQKKEVLEDQKKKVEKEILKQNRFLTTVIDSLTYPFYIIDLETFNIILANEAAKKFGFNEESTCYGKTYQRKEPCDPAEIPCPADIIKCTAEPTRLEYTHQSPDGSQKNIEVHAHPILDSQGKPVQMIKYLVDVTSRKTMEEELLKQKQLESIGILAGGIAHDLNNLLSVIIGNINLVKDDLMPGESHFTFLVNAENAGLKAADLAQKLTVFSRGGWLERKIVNLSDILHQVIAADPATKRVTSKKSIAQDLLPLMADRRQLMQVFTNLLRNAGEAGQEGDEIIITAENVLAKGTEMSEIADPSELQENDYVKVTIQDHGKGIPRKLLGKVFDPYFTTKPKDTTKGVGLGLTLCYSIISKHKGYILLNSEENVGTTATIYLPVNNEKNDSPPKMSE